MVSNIYAISEYEENIKKCSKKVWFIKRQAQTCDEIIVQYLNSSIELVSFKYYFDVKLFLEAHIFVKQNKLNQIGFHHMFLSEQVYSLQTPFC